MADQYVSLEDSEELLAKALLADDNPAVLGAATDAFLTSLNYSLIPELNPGNLLRLKHALACVYVFFKNREEAAKCEEQCLKHKKESSYSSVDEKKKEVTEAVSNARRFYYAMRTVSEIVTLQNRVLFNTTQDE